MEYQVLRDIEVLFGVALVVVIIFKRLKFPSIIGFLVTGLIAGPHTFGLIGNQHLVEQMAEIGVVLLLFTIGIEFSINELMRIRHMVLLGGGLQVALTILAILALGMLLGFPLPQSVFFGFLIALSSTAIIMKLLSDAGEMDTPHGKTAMGILIFQDLCVVPLMLLTPLLGGGGDGWQAIVAIIAKAAAVIVAAHYSARFLVPWVFAQVVRTRSRELFILMIIFVGIGTAWVTAWAGLSLALGAFIAGLAISESEYSHQALSDIMPFREAFISLFFISVGMLLDPAILTRYPAAIAGLILVILLLKTVITTGAVMALGLPLRMALMAGMTLSQIGEFSFVLAQVGVGNGLLTGDVYQVFLAASVATMGLTPLCMRLSDPVATRLTRFLPHSWTSGKKHYSGHKRTHLADHVIIVGYGLNGRNLARILKHLKLPYVVIETNPFTLKAERKRGEAIMFGDASKPEVLELAGVENARIMVIAISDAAASRRTADLARKMNPALHVIVRTRYLLEVEPLYRIGVNEVIPEEFETSVEILSRVLRKFLVPQDVVEESIAEVRRDGYEMLRSVSRRHSHAVGIAGFLSGAEIATYRVMKGSLLEGTALSDGILRSRSGATILAIKRGGEVVTNPDPVWELKEGDIVLLVGSPQQLAASVPLFEAGKGGA